MGCSMTFTEFEGKINGTETIGDQTTSLFGPLIIIRPSLGGIRTWWVWWGGTFSSLISPSSCTISSRRLSCRADMRRSSSSFLCLDDITVRQDASGVGVTLHAQCCMLCLFYVKYSMLCVVYGPMYRFLGCCSMLWVKRFYGLGSMFMFYGV